MPEQTYKRSDVIDWFVLLAVRTMSEEERQFVSFSRLYVKVNEMFKSSKSAISVSPDDVKESLKRLVSEGKVQFLETYGVTL